MKEKIGFTLAEVLINLGIIGIVAAMTLPMFISNYREKELITRAKKSASILWNALTAIQAEYGETDFSNIFATGSIDAEDTADMLAKHLKVIKRCKSGKTGCHDSPIKLAKPVDNTGNGTAGYFSTIGFRNLPQLVLADGSIIQVQNYGKCDRTYMGNVTDADGNVVTDSSANPVKQEYKASSCVDLVIDTNGNKGPNQVGADVFGMFIVPTGVQKGVSHGDLWNILYADKIQAVSYTPGTPIK